MIIQEPKTIFIHIPKTAGTSVESVFKPYVRLNNLVDRHATVHEIKNKLPLTFGRTNKKTLSNTEKAKLRNDESKKAFKASEGKTKHFYAPKNFNKGGRVGLKGGTNLGMQSVKYGLDNNPKITAADPKAKFIAANKKKKSKTPISQSVRKA